MTLSHMPGSFWLVKRAVPLGETRLLVRGLSTGKAAFATPASPSEKCTKKGKTCHRVKNEQLPGTSGLRKARGTASRRSAWQGSISARITITTLVHGVRPLRKTKCRAELSVWVIYINEAWE